MPCEDTTSRILVRLDENEKLIDFEYIKLACGKAIGGETALTSRVAGLHFTEILSLDFSALLTELGTDDDNANFFIFMQWDALIAALRNYTGTPMPPTDAVRFQVASIEYTETGTSLSLVITPLPAMPKLVPCNHTS